MLCVATIQGHEDGGELDVCDCGNEKKRRGIKVGERERGERQRSKRYKSVENEQL